MAGAHWGWMVLVMALCRGDREEIRIKMVHPSLGEKHLYLESVDTHNVDVDSRSEVIFKKSSNLYCPLDLGVC